MIVVKLGGGAGVEVDRVLADVAVLVKEGRKVVLVHGTSDAANRLSEALGRPPRFVTSVSGHTSRFTDRETMDVVAMAAGGFNAEIVEKLQRLGCDAVGLTGLDGRLLTGPRKDTVRAVVDGKQVLVRGDHSGIVQRVNARLLTTLLDGGWTPVVTLPALAYDDGMPAASEASEAETRPRRVTAVNVDADRAGAAVAGALRAEAYVVLTNVPGLLRDKEDPASLVREVGSGSGVGIDDADRLAQGRFKKKVLAAKEALEGGVPRVVVAGSAAERPVASALAGEGTVFGRAAASAVPPRT